MADPHRACPSCGRPLRSDTLEDLCPACLLAAGLEALSPDRADAVEDAAPGVRRFGDYILIEEIDRGGMGVVHKARQISLDRIVALKMILGGTLAGSDHIERFRDEAQAAATLRHPNIVAIHEVGEHQGQLYFTMDYIEGKNLAQVISEMGFQNTDFRRSARWIKAVADAVHHAHQHGVLHRDIKPANILIDQDDQPHITDFGLAKRFTVVPSADPTGPASAALHSPRPTRHSELTLSGQVLGSPSYLSPEQAEGRRSAVGVASDVYSIGAVLYHLLTGRPPFQGETFTALLRQVIEIDPVPPRRLNPSIPRDLETICLACLEKEPSRRYAGARQLGDELGRFLANEPIRARPIGRSERTWRWCRRNPKLAGALGAAVLCLALGLGTTTWQMRRAQASEATARHQAYVSDMGLACRALAEENPGRVRSLLDRYAPPHRVVRPVPQGIGDRIARLGMAIPQAEDEQSSRLPALHTPALGVGSGVHERQPAPGCPRTRRDHAGLRPSDPGADSRHGPDQPQLGHGFLRRHGASGFPGLDRTRGCRRSACLGFAQQCDRSPVPLHV